MPDANDVDDNPDYYNFDPSANKPEAVAEIAVSYETVNPVKKAAIDEYEKHQRLNRDQLEVARARHLDIEERNRLNPNNMLIRLLFINLEPFYPASVMQAVKEHASYTRAEKEEWTDRNRLFALFVAKTCTVLELKNAIDEDFGLAFDGIKVCFDNKEQEHGTYLSEIPDADVTQDSILTVVSTLKPKLPVNQVIRLPLNEIRTADVRYFNTSTKMKPWSDWHYTAEGGFDLDDPKTPWPVYRDWTQEAAQLSKIIVRTKTQIIAEEREMDLIGGRSKHADRMAFNYSPTFQELTNAERLYHKL